MFKILLKDDLWYNLITKNTSNLKVYLNHGTLQKIRFRRIKQISGKVLDGNYKFRLSKKITILDNKTLRLLTTNEKIIYQLIRILLKTVCNYSVVQPNIIIYQTTKLQSTIESFISNFQDLTWTIKSRIKIMYLSFNHQQLNSILAKKIQDFRFTNLIFKSLQFEILLYKKWTKSSIYISNRKNSILTITNNICYKEWDKLIQKIILNQLVVNYQTKKSQQLDYQINQTIEQVEKLDKKSSYYNIFLNELKIFNIKQVNILNLAIKDIKINYIRYAYDWMVGVRANKIFLNQIKTQIINFIVVNLKYQFTKIQTSNLYINKLNFFGYSILYPQKNTINISWAICNYKKNFQRKLKLQFDIPINSIMDRIAIKYCVETSVRSYYLKKTNPIIALKRKMVLKSFLQVWVGLATYYSLWIDINKIQYLHYRLNLYCVMALKYKHRLSLKKMFFKYGKKLIVFNNLIQINKFFILN